LHKLNPYSFSPHPHQKDFVAFSPIPSFPLTPVIFYVWNFLLFPKKRYIVIALVLVISAELGAVLSKTFSADFLPSPLAHRVLRGKAPSNLNNPMLFPD